MKELENHSYLIGYLISNAFALMLLFFAVKSPRVARVLFFLLFVGASWINWKIALQSPQLYIRTSDAAIVIYRKFITGWFSKHVVLVVGFIATAQAFIAASLLLKGLAYKIGLIAGIVFLLAIMPLGIVSAFPATLTMADAMVWLLRRKADYVWKSINKRENRGFSLRNFPQHAMHQH